MSTASLTVIADTRKFQAELAKIPGYTEKSAAKAGLKMAMEMEKAQAKAADAATRAAKRAGDAWDVAIKVKIVDAFANASMSIASSVAGWVAAGITAADSMGDLSQETGVAVETLLAIRDAAMRAGEEFEPLQQSFAGMAKKIYDFAATGGGRAADVFRDLGVEVKNVDGSLRGVNEISVETIAGLQAMTDKTQQAALATKLLGEDGQQLLRVLGDRSIVEWSASMTHAAADVERTNVGIDAMNIALAQMKGLAADAGGSMGAAFGPALAKWLLTATWLIKGAASDAKALYMAFDDITMMLANEAPTSDWAAWTKASADNTQNWLNTLKEIDAIGQPSGAAGGDGIPPMLRRVDGAAPAASKPTGNTASNRGAAEVKAHDDDMRRMQEKFDAAIAGDAFLKQIDDEHAAEIARMASLEEEDHQRALARIAEQQAAEAEAWEARKQLNMQIVQGAMNVASSLFDVYAQSLQAEVDATKSGSEANKAALRKQWEAQHAAASASALINIALATSQSLASAPFPANVALGALSAIAATAAFVKVASAKPPSFHVGSMGNRSSNRQSDEYAATLKRNEVVVPAPTVAANGGPGGVERALSGNGATYIAISIDGKELDAAVDRRLVARGIPPRGHKFRAVQ